MRVDGPADLLEQHIPGLRRYATALLRDGDEADDLVQDTLERALSRWSQRRPDGDLRAWLFALLRNLHLDALRRRSRRGLHVSDAALETAPSLSNGHDAAGVGRDILNALEALPEEQRSVLLLIAVEDFSYVEAAAALGVPLGTIMSRLSRAREKMRCYMETGRATKLRSVR